MVNAMHEAALPGSMSGAAEQDAGSSIPVSADTGVSEDSEDAASIQFGPSDFLSVESASNVAASDMAMNPSAPQTGTQAGDMAMNPSRKAKPRRKVLLEGKQGKKQHTTGTTPEVKSPDRKAERTYVRQKRKLSSLEKCSGPATEQTSSGGAECAATCRTASVRRRLQFEIGEKGVQGDQSSAANSCHHVEEKLIHAKISSCSATTILSTAQSGHGLHVDMDNSADGLVFDMIRINNEVLDEYLHWPEIAPDTTQQISTATSGCCSREPTREHDKLVITHDLDATSMGVAITEGNGKDLDLSLLAEGVTDHNVHKYQRTRIKLKSLSQLNDHTVLSTPATFMDRTITKICMRTSGSEKIGTLQNEETPARKPKPRRKKHRAKVIREKKHDSTVTTPEVKSPNKKAKRSYVRKKRNLSSLEKCSSRTASVRRRLQFEIGEQDLDATSMGVTITEGKNTDMEVNYSNKDGFDMHRSATLAFGPAGGVKNKRSVRVRRKSFVPIMDIEMNNAQTSTRCLKIMTKKRSPRGRPHSHSPVQSNMDKKNMFSPGKVSSGGSNRSKVSYGKFQQASRLAPKKRKNNLDQMENEMHPSLTTSAVVSFGATSGLSNSLVAFGGQLIFPYERPLDLVKKQSPRAKVDLDFETTRVWNLLMGKVTKPLDGTDVDKDRWWNQEREVFHGRAKSFIARMRLVQGDRHFSPWKGSVVDSVVGVFLTQNVSDHLSSSAYMALSASFPPGSVNSSCKDDITSQDTELIISKNYPPRNCVGGIIGAASQQLGTNFDSSLARNDATTKELECQGIKTAVNDDGLGEHGILSTSMMYYPFISVDHQQPDVTIERYVSPSSSSGSASSLLKNGITGKKLSLFMPSDNPTSQMNCSKNVISTRNSPKTRTDLPVELHCNKRATFEASDLQEHASLSTTGGTIAETAKGVNGFTSYNGVLDKTAQASRPKKIRTTNKKDAEKIDWDKFRRQACDNGHMKERIFERRDSVDWEAVRCADVHKISHAIWQRGLSNILAERIQSFLNRLVRDHGSIDLEWLRDIPPDSAKDYLLSIRGLGLKSVECVRLLSLHHVAFPVDTNVGRICVRLGWVPIQPLPESLQLHLLELYPVLETIQKYLWPRLCKLDQHTLYELHYHMITFGKVFCTKSKPNCNACPLRSECRYFASAFASARLALPAPEAKGLVYSSNEFNFHNGGMPTPNSTVLPQLEGSNHGRDFPTNNSEPIIEEPASPIVEERLETVENDIEDYDADTGEIPIIKLNLEAFAQNVENCIKERNKDLRSDDIAKALVAISTEEASIPVPKLKNVRRLRTEHYVYELPDSHPLVQQLGLDKREPDDPSPYLFTIWMQDDIKEMSKAPKPCCDSQTEDGFCNNQNCQYCVDERENQSKHVRGTILVPCRTAMKGSFPLNGTYFQVNEVFADHKSSHDPIHVAREQLWNLQRRMVYFGTSVPAIFKGLTTEEVQQCFWRGFVCVRGFDMDTRAPRPLCPHLHLAASKLPRSCKSAATEQNSDLPRASVS